MHNRLKPIFTNFMPSHNTVRLRNLRNRSGLTQRELAQVLEFRSGVAISRHERSDAIPDLLTAIGYEIIFRAPLSQIFPGLYETVHAGIDERLAKLEEELGQSSAKGRNAIPVARKLEFLYERRNPA